VPPLPSSLSSSLSSSSSSSSSCLSARDDYDSLSDDGDDAVDIPLGVLIDDSISHVIRIHHSRVEAAACELMRTDFDLLGHLRALRRYFLMDAGDMHDTFLSMLFSRLHDTEALSSVSGIANPHELSAQLDAAIRSSSCAKDPFADRLRVVLTVDDVDGSSGKKKQGPAGHHAKPPGRSSGSAPATRGSGADGTLGALDHVGLELAVEWPLTVVITARHLAQYNTIFRFMVRQRRVSHELRRVWTAFQSHSARALSRDPRMHELALFRHEVRHFVGTLESFILTQVLHVAWADFEAETARAQTITALRAAHAAFLERATHHCLLHESAASIISIIETTYAHIIRFCVVVAGASTGQQMLDSYPTMMKSKHAFRQYTRFLYRVLRGLARKGSQPHLEDLITRLNFNGQYDSAEAAGGNATDPRGKGLD
jgi:gamma-tubulin complex component 6